MRRSKPLILALLMLAACTNRVGLEGDIGDLLDNCGVQASIEQVQMSDRSRTGIVVVAIDDAGINALVECLNLQPGGQENAMIAVALDEGRQEFEHDYIKNIGGLNLYISKRRPVELTLESGTAFEYLLLYHNAAEGKAVIQVSYAYG